MESAETSLKPYVGPRFKLILGKFPVVRVHEPVLGIKQFAIQMQGVRVVIDAPHDVDVREGDLLSLYTEVPLGLPKKENGQ